MEQLRQIGEVLGSLRALMAFRDEIQINQRQCCLLADLFDLAFDSVVVELKQQGPRLIDDKLSTTRWRSVEGPLRELQGVLRDGGSYIRRCSEARDWWSKAALLGQSTDAVDLHIHNLLWCVPVVIEAVEAAGEAASASEADPESLHRRRLLLTKKYEREWVDPELFRNKLGRQYLASPEVRGRLESAPREDVWVLTDAVARAALAPPLADLLAGPRGRMLPSSALVGARDYQVRRRLGQGSSSSYKEVQWMGESFAVRHFIGEVEPIAHEVSHLSSINHPNVMRVVYAFSDEGRKECFLLMELMNKNIHDHIREVSSSRKKLPFPLIVAVDAMIQIARGMEYLHSRKMYHGELNPSNVLVKPRSSSSDGYLDVKITGFGFSALKNVRQGTASSSASSSSSIWYAPEVLVEQDQSAASVSKYTESADVYSFGMICFELLTGKIPFEDSHLQGDRVSRNIRAGERPLFPFPSPLKCLTGLTKRCWQAEPSLRPSFSSLCRVLRYIKRFLVMNPPDVGQPDHPPQPPVDYFDLEVSLSKRFPAWNSGDTTAAKVAEVPFQMFAYRAMEREKTCANLKDKSSDSSSEGTSVCGDEQLGMSIVDDPFSARPLSPSVLSPRAISEPSRESPAKKMNVRVKSPSGGQQGPKGRSPSMRPPKLSLSVRALRTKSDIQLPTAAMMSPGRSPGRRKTSGHVSDPEIA